MFRRLGEGWSWEERQKRDARISGLNGERGLPFQPSATFQQVRLEHNVVYKGRKGMVIHLDFHVRDSKDRTVTAGVLFSANEGFLMDRNGEFCTANGQVYTGDSFRPGSISQTYTDARLFMPYFELHLPSGNHSLKCLAFIWDVQGRPLGSSNTYPFTVKIA